MTAQEKNTTIRYSGVSWQVIENPEKESLEKLQKKYRFHELDIEDCLSNIQRPKIDEYDKYLFIVLHVPQSIGRGEKKQIRTSEVKIFIGKDYLITIHNGNKALDKILDKVKSKLKAKKEYMGLGTGYMLYMLVDHLFDSCLPLLDELSEQVKELEDEVFEMDYTKDRLKDILILKNDLINFRRIIMPQRAVVAQLEHKNKKFIPEKLDLYFDDIVDNIEKIWNNIGNLQELASSIQDTNESIISHNTNKVIKALTIMSVVMLPLTFITGFYGMNVTGLPYADGETSMMFVGGVLVVVSIVMIAFFKLKKWL